MINIQNKADCCGCTACVNICPKKCITMTPDEEGFLYPNVDKSVCIDCGLCEKVCPVANPPITVDGKQDLTSYVVRVKENDVLKISTSGGGITAVNQYVINKGGYVCGCVLDGNFLTTHYITNNGYELSAFCGSKYVQSNLGDCFTKIKWLLDNNHLVCFIGTPCQVAGLKNYLRKDYDRLITIDLVCRSIPSTELYKKYLEYQQLKYKSKIKSVNFRSKTYGYHSGTLTIEFENGKRYSGSNRVDLFMKSFHSDIASRPSCYDCKFKTVDRCSDFTFFDCWRAEHVVTVPMHDDDKGYSNVILHSDKAKKIISEIYNIEIYPADTNKMLLYTGGMEKTSIRKPEKRDKFISGLATIDANNLKKYIKGYINISFKDILIEKLKVFLYKTKLLKLLKKFK